MSGDSKKRNELKRQISNKTQVAPIELVEKIAGLLNAPKNWQIIENIATIPGGVENTKFVICLDYLDWDECHFDQFDPAKGKKLVQILEQVSKCEVAKFPELRLVRDSVSRTGVYTSLFDNLSPEVDELKETELCDGRLFFFITEPRFNIVSVESKHRNT